MRVKRQILVTAIVTEQLKEEVMRELQASLDRVNASQKELEAQSRRYMLQLPNADMVSALRQQVETETRRFESTRRELLERQEEISKLDIGDRINYTTLEGDIELSVGDNLTERLAGGEIVILDGVIEEIKEG
jgi:sRNA-binding protein